MRRFLGWSLGMCFAGAFLGPAIARAQAGGQWHAPDSDAAHDNWQKAEKKVSPETVPGSFKFLWKIKLGGGAAQSQSFSEPLLIPGLITGRGFKDMALWGDSSSLYSVDSELGTLLWQKDFKAQSSGARGACAGSNLQILMEPPPVIHFGAHRPHAAPPPPPLAPEARRIGASAGGGFFGLRGIFVLTSDGYIHEQILATGLDYAPAVKFLAAPGGDSFGLNMADNTVYTESGEGCHEVPNAVWSIDLNTPQYAVTNYQPKNVSLNGLSGPAIGSDDTVYVSTAGGKSDPSTGAYAGAVVALTPKELKVKDWYTPGDSGKGNMLHAGPVVLMEKGKELVAAPGKDGSLVLLDSTSLGGSDHHTPLAQTGRISKTAKKGAWESLAAWQDKTGSSWVLASISGPVERDMKFANTNGSAPHGSIVAFKVDAQDGHPVLTPVWVSRDLKNPAPPAIVNGVVFALAGGDASDHAILYALDAATGKELYASGDAIDTYTHLAGMSVGDGHVFFTTHDNTLYSFGIPMEH